MTAPRAVPSAPGFTEAQFTDRIVDTAHLYGWKAAHFRAGRTAHGYRTPLQYDAKGWPDLILVHPDTGTVLAVEVKLWRNRKPAPEQEQWLRWLNLCGISAAVWTERDWEAVILPTLSRPGRHLQRNPSRALYTGGK